MSIAQVKKRVAEMEAYLGNDKEGIKRLKLLKDEVNTLRTDLAAAKEETQLANTIKDAARERADAAEAALQEAQLEIHALRQRTNSLMHDLDVVTRVEEPVEEEELTLDKEVVAMRVVMKTLRKKLRYCPETIGYFGPAGNTAPIFNREDIAKGWSHESIWTLGAAVAILTTTMGRLGIYGVQHLAHFSQPGINLNLRRHIYEWLSHNNTKDLPLEGSVRDALYRERQEKLNGVKFDS